MSQDLKHGLFPPHSRSRLCEVAELQSSGSGQWLAFGNKPKSRAPLPFRSVNLRGSADYDPGLQRHHLLPRQLQQKRSFSQFFADIAPEWSGFNDFRSNGMLLPASDAAAIRIGLPLHRGPHRDYNAMVIERVGQVEGDWSRARPRHAVAARGDAVMAMQALQRGLRQSLLDPGRKPLALSRFDPLGRGDFAGIDAMVDALWPASDPWSAHARSAGDPVPAWVMPLPMRADQLAFA